MPSTMPMPTDSDTGHPRLAPHVRLTFDPARQRHILLTPETVTVLNDTGAAILELCNGERTVGEILAGLRDRYDRVADDEVRAFLGDLLVKRRMVISGG
jgi:pyrroloquinoline quinone biosynthesis protein D